MSWNLVFRKESLVVHINHIVHNFHLISKTKLTAEVRKIKYTYLCVCFTVLLIFSSYRLCQITYLCSFMFTVKLINGRQCDKLFVILWLFFCKTVSQNSKNKSLHIIIFYSISSFKLIWNNVLKIQDVYDLPFYFQRKKWLSSNSTEFTMLFHTHSI